MKSIHLFKKYIAGFLIWGLAFFLTLSPIQAQEENSEPVPLLTNEFSIFYQNSFQFFTHSMTTASGWHESQLRAAGQVLMTPEWLFRASMIGERSDIELANFSHNPVFSSDSFTGELGLNYILSKQKSWEWASGLSYLFYSYKPDNKDLNSSNPISYTGSVLDFEQTFQGPGLSSVGYYQISEKLSALANASLYPFLFTQVKKGPAIDYLMMVRANLQLRYTLVEGFLINGFFNQEFWTGGLTFSNTTIGVGLTLVPSQIPED